MQDVVAADGFTSLREAVSAANAQPAGQEQLIVFAANTNGQAIQLNSQLTLEKKISIIGNGAWTTTIERNAAMGDFRLIEIKPSSDAIIADLKLRGGKAETGTNGGAIFVGGSLTIIDCIIRDSRASRGGAIATSARVLPGAVAVKSSLTIEGCLITNNNASFGGGVAVIDGDLLAHSGVEVSWNTAIFGGGGVFVDSVTAGLAPVVTLHSVFNTGNSTEFDGGGVLVRDGVLNLNGGSITYNTAAAEGRVTRGGGVFVDEKGTVNVSGAMLIGHNNASVVNGDGMYIKLGGSKTGAVIYEEDTEYDENPV